MAAEVLDSLSRVLQRYTEDECRRMSHELELRRVRRQVSAPAYTPRGSYYGEWKSRR